MIDNQGSPNYLVILAQELSSHEEFRSRASPLISISDWEQTPTWGANQHLLELKWKAKLLGSGIWALKNCHQQNYTKKSSSAIIGSHSKAPSFMIWDHRRF